MAEIVSKGIITIEFTKDEYDALVALLGNMSENDMNKFLSKVSSNIDYADELVGIYMDIS